MAVRPSSLGIVLAALLAARALVAQPAQSRASVAARTVDGRVVVLREKGEVPIADLWVTLHRVASDSAGPIDSVRTDGRGGFSFRYRPFGADDALYFASTRYGGVAYFTSPLREPAARGEAAEIAVYDTTSQPVPTTVRGRHLIVSAPDARGTRSVIEVFEVSNDTSVTAIDREGSAGTWSAAVPAAARRLEVRQGEIPSDALLFSGGRAALHMPLAPGLKQIAFSYSLDGDAFPLAVIAERRTTVFEVLIEDARGGATGPKLVAVDPVLVEGRSFRRFLAQEVPAGSRLVIDVPRGQPSWVRWIVPALLGVLGLGMLSVLAWPRRRVPAARPPAPATATASEAARLAREIAALDDAFEGGGELGDADFAQRRAALKSRLTEALAGEDRRR